MNLLNGFENKFLIVIVTPFDLHFKVKLKKKNVESSFQKPHFIY